MRQLYLDLADPTYGIDASRFTVDWSFDWSRCSSSIYCPSDCSLEQGATELANHIASLPVGHVVLVGYSMGGLLARDIGLVPIFETAS